MLLIGRARRFSAVGYREKLRKRMDTGCGPVFVAEVGLWPSLALLFTYRAEVRVGGYRNIENFKKAIFFYCGGLDLDPR